MTGAELRRALERIFGPSWRIPASRWLGMDLRTLDRQVNGSVDVRGPVIAAVMERQKLEDIRASWRRRQDRWIKRGARMQKYQPQILANAMEGVPLITKRPPGAHYVGAWENATLRCQEQGWLDEDRKITEEGAQALAVVLSKRKKL